MAEHPGSVPPRRRLAVVGHPIGHSRSPAMQRAALEELGLADQWTYEAIDLEPGAFEGGVRELAAAGFAGINVTVPHKESALELSDTASPAAREIGAANTLLFSDHGIAAENTDGPAITQFLPDDLGGEGCLVLGAGGAARAAVWALTGVGGSVSIWNRTQSRAEELAAGMGCTAVERVETGGYAVIVNASAAGLDGSDPFTALPLDPSGFRGGQLMIDMVYGHGPGPLIEAARSAGARAVDGIEVLVAQGALSFEIWTGLSPSREVMERAARAV